jgi:YVTN family beta-propeller protein
MPRISHGPRRAATLAAISVLLLVSITITAPALATPSFTLFESGQVRPLALSPNGKLLFAVNTPDNRLEVFRIKNNGLTHRFSVPVGLEPVAVAARSNREVWVVNHLSDSVSVVEISESGQTGNVERTLLVGDEPRDIVFAGPGKKRAFITTAHRGQNIPFDPQLTTEGIGRADVWVFDASHLGASLEGDPITILTLFTDTPRALAVTPNGHRVYAAGFHSGNRTTTIHELLVPDGFGPTGLDGPSTNFEGAQAPEVGQIVKFNGAHWVDSRGNDRDYAVKLSLPDKDVFAINAMANPPALVAGPAGVFTGVGTILFNMAVNPVSGKVYVSNTEARNDDRLEGPGIFAGHSLRGHLHESRITVLDPAGGVTPRHLNKHIDFGSCCAPVPSAENAKSLAQPVEMAITGNGAKLYVAALGSSKVGVFSTAALESDSFVPNAANQISVQGGGPSGLVLDEDKHRLYVLTRFDNAISIIDTQTETEIAHVPMHNPEPPSIVNGRRFLYDASLTSSHGDSSCASCHIFGDFDSLAWDLGNPDDLVTDHPGPFLADGINIFTGEPMERKFHPLKGPMVTQSLRGMANHGPMHWRGDRTGGNDAPTAQPDSGTFDERAAFGKFQAGFTDLLGRSEVLPAADMEAFTDFILQVTYPPNPIRPLDNQLTADQEAGRQLFSEIEDGTFPCTGCHVIDLDGNPGSDAPGFFATEGAASFDFITQMFKVPHFRNMYQKVGRFGQADIPGVFFSRDIDHTGDQVRGIGIAHDGTIDTIFRFVDLIGFTNEFPLAAPNGLPSPPDGDVQRRQMEAFILAFDSNMAPIVGQQVTLGPSNGAVADPRIDLLISRADAGECDLVVKGRVLNHELGFVYIGADHFNSNRQALPLFPDGLLRLLAFAGTPLTYTCAPPGSGERIGIDRDEDGHLDGDEDDAGSDPADASSTP